jgi:Predicted membrane protein
MAAINPAQLMLGGFLALLASAIGWKLGWLSLSGAVAAFLMGLIVFGLGGLPWAVVLLVFFFTSSFLSILFRAKKGDTEKYTAKGSRRDAGQVLANGGLASLFVLLHWAFPGAVWAWVGFAAAFAAANADTWATEIGTLSQAQPRLITSGKRVEKGTSGGISLAGTLGSAAGSALIALTAWFAWPGVVSTEKNWLCLSILFAGLLGSLVDSWLGATVQRVNYCPACQKETERTPLHSCGTQTVYLRGWRWLDNDWVNILCTLATALFALVVAVFVH